MKAAYRTVVLWIVSVLTFIYCRKYEVVGREHVPRQGGYIVVSNHLNNADPPVIARAVRRPVVFMAKKEMLDLPAVGWLMKAWGAFPVRRGEADLSALRAASEVVKNGELLMMFPEGTRSRTGRLNRGHPGTALIALRTGAPILPVAVTGTEVLQWPALFFRPRCARHIRVVIGEAFTLPRGPRVDTESVNHATDVMMQSIAALLPPEYRGEYALSPATSMPQQATQA